MAPWNVFRVAGDISHILSKCILIFAIHRNRSAEGVSMITQVLYAVVFVTRYTDIFSERYLWNLFFKIFYILSSFYIIFAMRFLFQRTREREIAWKMGAAAAIGSLLVSPFAMLIFEPKAYWGFFKWLWSFSEILESVCVLPQLLLLRQTTVPTVIDSFYLVALGAYRGLYILNWIARGLDSEDVAPDAISIVFGIIQTALYIDFFWVYYSRQRVKLRGGGVVDADDIRRGWLLNRIFGNKRFNEEHDEDEESGPALGGGSSSSNRRSKWGARGISVSADEGVLDNEAGGSSSSSQHDTFNDAPVDPDAKMRDPDELARALDDEDEDEDEEEESDSDDDSRPGAARATPSGVNGGNEWRD